MTQFQIAELFSEAYGKAATVSNAISGFKKTGINPLNRDVFPEYLFVPSSVTDLPENSEPIALGEQSLEVLQDKRIEGNRAGPSLQNPTNESINVSLEDISPLPKANRIVKKRKKNTQSAAVLTDSPFIKMLQQKEEEKEEKLMRKTQREAAKKASKKVFQDSDASDVEIPFENDDDDSQVSCIYCNELYSMSKTGEHWICCQKCRNWCHVLCAGVSNKIKQFICELCH